MEKKFEEGDRKGLKDLKESMSKVHDRLEKVERERGGHEGRLGNNIEERLRNMEMYLERKDREGRKKNIVIRGLIGKDSKEVGEKELERLWEKMEVKVRVEKIVLNEKKGSGKGLIIVELGSEMEKKAIMVKKKCLRGEKVWIEEGLTKRERKIKWKLREIAGEERRAGVRVCVSYNKINKDNKWWFLGRRYRRVETGKEMKGKGRISKRSERRWR